MPSRRLFLLAAASVVGSLAVSSALAEEPSPQSFLDGIYKRLVSGKGGSGGQIYWSDPKDRAKWFSAALVKSWAAAEERAKSRGDEAAPVDFDPFTNSQDPQIKGYALEKLDAVPPVTKIRVTLKGAGYADPGDGVLVFDLVQEKGWKIDDVQGSAGGDRWSLKEILSMP